MSLAHPPVRVDVGERRGELFSPDEGSFSCAVSIALTFVVMTNLRMSSRHSSGWREDHVRTEKSCEMKCLLCRQILLHEINASHQH